MKFLLLLIALFLFPSGFVQGVSGQNTGDWKAFTFDNGRYSINLPASPVEELQKIAEDRFSLYTNTLKQGTFNYSFTYVDFGLGDTDEQTAAGLFDSWEKGLASSIPKEAIRSETVKFQGANARRVVSNYLGIRMDGIALVRQGRLIAIVVSSQVAADDSAVNAKTADHATSFFETFRYKPGIQEPVTLSDPNKDKIKAGTVFQSDYGFEITLPEGWEIIGNDLIREGLNFTTQDTRITRKKKSELENSLDQSEIIFSVGKGLPGVPGTSIFGVGVEPVLGDKNASTKTIAEGTYQVFQQEMYFEPVAAPKLVRVNGVTFYLFKVKKEYNGNYVWLNIYMKRFGSEIVQFVLTHHHESLLREMETSMSTIKMTSN